MNKSPVSSVRCGDKNGQFKPTPQSFSSGERELTSNEEGKLSRNFFFFFQNKINSIDFIINKTDVQKNGKERIRFLKT